MSLLISSKTYTKNADSIFYGLRISLATIILLMLLSSCGLPNYAYLYPPTDVKTRFSPTDGDYDLIFRNAYENSVNIFSGYEIYYKIYDPLNDSTSESEYLTDYKTIEDSKTSGFSILSNNDFHRLYTTTSNDAGFIHNDTKPAFKLEPEFLDENFQIRFLFDQVLPYSYYAAAYDFSSDFSENPYLYRYVENDSTNTIEKKFFGSDDFDINDSDMPDTIDEVSYAYSESEGYYLYITFYILSYGRDPDNITTSIYSLPVYLGTLSFDVDLTNN